MSDIKWKDSPEDHDYPAAENYLSLIFQPDTVKKYVDDLRQAPLVDFFAKDISRASSLPLLGKDNIHVQSNLNKIDKGDKLSPILLVRAPELGKVIIADGYHRLCAVYVKSEDEPIKCKII